MNQANPLCHQEITQKVSTQRVMSSQLVVKIEFCLVIEFLEASF